MLMAIVIVMLIAPTQRIRMFACVTKDIQEMEHIVKVGEILS